MKQLSLFIKLLVILTLIACSTKVAGTVDETDTSIAGLITPVGMPVSGAKVKFYASRSDSGVAIDSTYTDEKGQYSLSMLNPGTYAIWAETDTSVLFKDSIVITASETYAEQDTLFSPRRIVIPVKIQEQHDARMVQSHILGTHVYPVVDRDSYLTIEKCPQTTFPLRLWVENDYDRGIQYTPKTWEITIDSESPDTLNTVLELEYTGVPIVTNVVADFDIETEVTSLSWDADTSGSVTNYLVYRDTINPVVWSETPIVAVTDTTFQDSLRGKGLTSGTYIYRVLIRRDDQVGSFLVKHCDTIQYVDPVEEFNFIADTHRTLAVNDTTQIPLRISPWFGENISMTVQLGDRPLQTIEVVNDSISLIISDTLGDSIPLIFTVIGSETTKSDTLFCSVSTSLEKTAESPSVSGIYTSPITYQNALYMSVLSSDNGEIFTSLDNGESWSSVGATSIASSDSTRASNLVTHNDSLRIVDGNGILWSSEDGSNWSKTTTAPVVTTWSGDARSSQLYSNGNQLTLVIENSSALLEGATSLNFFTFDPTSNSFTAMMTPHDYRWYAYHYWLVTSVEGFMCYVYREDNVGRAIDVYRIRSEVEHVGTIVQNSSDGSVREGRSRALSIVEFAGGHILLDGAGMDRALWIEKDPVSYDEIATKEVVVNGNNCALTVISDELYSIGQNGIYR